MIPTVTLLMFLGLWTSFTAGKSLRIRDGKDDENNIYPFAVSLRTVRDGVYYRSCSGSLIAAKWVLTAAHCVRVDPAPNFVRFGDMTVPQNETNSYRKVIKVFPHPNYQPLLGHNILPAHMKFLMTKNDIGLMLLENLEGIKLARVSGMDYKSFGGLPVTFAGFGRINEDFSDTEYLRKPLQVGEGIVTNCYSPEKHIFNPGICVAPKCNTLTSARWGDSGGPLMVRDTIIGVASGFGSPVVTVFCPVSPFLGWINMVMLGNHESGSEFSSMH